MAQYMGAGLPEAWLLHEYLPRCQSASSRDGVGSGLRIRPDAARGASLLPSWMVRTGLVQFYGQDLDAACACGWRG